MKIAISGDGHADERSRFEEWKRVHAWMADDWRKRGVQVVLDAGDVYERASTPAERIAVAEHKLKVGEFAQQVIVKGNHDRAVDLLLLEKLKTRHPIRVLERAEVVAMMRARAAKKGWGEDWATIEQKVSQELFVNLG